MIRHGGHLTLGIHGLGSRVMAWLVVLAAQRVDPDAGKSTVQQTLVTNGSRLSIQMNRFSRKKVPISGKKTASRLLHVSLTSPSQDVDRPGWKLGSLHPPFRSRPSACTTLVSFPPSACPC
ncbi:hypothetical protein C4K35_0052 [Pseudomonas chlororaphis subsp. piscium]|nr:hypothetical protein C4K35_0052 [Pseudomonas chlororaphis subsp. piscium]